MKNGWEFFSMFICCRAVPSAVEQQPQMGLLLDLTPRHASKDPPNC